MFPESVALHVLFSAPSPLWCLGVTNIDGMIIGESVPVCRSSSFEKLRESCVTPEEYSDAQFSRRDFSLG